MALLRISREGRESRTVELAGRDLRLGRASENDVVLEDTGTAVSRYHAELRVVGDGYVLVNLSQPFGIWTAGERVERVEMGRGVEAAIGPFRLLVEAAASAPVVAFTGHARPKSEAVPVRQETDDAAPVVPVAAAPIPAAVSPDTRAEAPAGVVALRTPITTAPPPGEPAPSLSVANWVVFGAVAAGLVGVVGLAQLISPATLTRPEPVEAAAAPTPPAVADEAFGTQMAAAREALDRHQPDVALRALEPVLSRAPEHAEALALKARIEEAQGAESGAEPTGSHGAPSGAGDAGALPAPVQTKSAESAVARPSTAAARARAATPGAKPLLQRPGTKDPAFAGRNADAVRRFVQAQSAFEAGEYRLAISNLQSVLRTDPSFPTAADKLEEVKSTVREMAEGAFAEGLRLEKAGDLASAIRAYEKSQETATLMYGTMTGAEDAIARVRETMVATGVDAFKRARQYDALGRPTDAVAMYAKALELLPRDDPNRQVAQERLGALKR